MVKKAGRLSEHDQQQEDEDGTTTDATTNATAAANVGSTQIVSPLRRDSDTSGGAPPDGAGVADAEAGANANPNANANAGAIANANVAGADADAIPAADADPDILPPLPPSPGASGTTDFGLDAGRQSTVMGANPAHAATPWARAASATARRPPPVDTGGPPEPDENRTPPRSLGTVVTFIIPERARAGTFSNLAQKISQRVKSARRRARHERAESDARGFARKLRIMWTFSQLVSNLSFVLEIKVSRRCLSGMTHYVPPHSTPSSLGLRRTF